MSSTSHHLDSLKNVDLDDSASDDIEWMDKWVIRFIKAVAITLAVLVVGGCFSVIVPIGKHALTYEKTPDSSTSRKARTSAPSQVPGKSKQDSSGFNEGSNESQSQQNSDEGAQKNQQSDNSDSQNPNNNESEHDYTEDLKSAGGEIGNDLKKAGEQAVNKGRQAGESASEWLKNKWNSVGESGQNYNSSGHQNQDENEQSAESDEGSSEEQPVPQNDPSQNQ